MRIKRKLCCITIAFCLAFCLPGCSGGAAPDMALTESDTDGIYIPEQVQVVGLGEASHGVKEYQELKADVFRHLVEDYGCRTFIIEGDFGNALKVDSYIHGGEGTAKEAASWIGFTIYCTKEMEDLLEWMRVYNETAVAGEDLHFYGMDMQFADKSKEYLFGILEQIDPELSVEYEGALAFLNDGDMYDINSEQFEQGLPVAEKLIQSVEQQKDRIEEKFGNETYEFARECANSLYNCCDIRKSDKDYNQVRDGHMAEKVQWFLEHGDGSMLFINGHNGHIGRTNATLYDCLGKHLAEELGDGYFAIGTDAEVTTFNSQIEGGFKEVTVSNKNKLNALVSGTDDCYYIDMAKAAGDDRWHKIVSDEQRITCLNVGGITFLKIFYTSKVVPEDGFDGMIVFGEVSPTTIS